MQMYIKLKYLLFAILVNGVDFRDKDIQRQCIFWAEPGKQHLMSALWQVHR